MPSAKLSEVLEHLSSLYNSVDLRIACCKYDQRLINILTTIRFSDEHADDLRTKLPSPVQTEDFRTILCPLEVAHWKELRKDIASGKLEVQGTSVDLGVVERHIDSANCNLMQYRSSYFLEQDWPEYIATLNRPPDMPIQQHLERIAAQVRKLDYRDAYQAISESLRVYFSPNMNLANDLFLALPVYAKIEGIDFDDELVSLDLGFHEKLKDARLVVQLLTAEAYSGRSGPKKDGIVRTLAHCSGSPIERNFCQTKVSGRLTGAAFDDYLEVRMNYEGLEIGEESHQVRRYLRKYPGKFLGTDFPLARVLSRFLPPEKLKEELVSPEKFKGRRLTPGSSFERGVGWLLGISGFTVVKLDENEKLREPETNVEIGAVDIIAYSPQYATLLAVSCTMAVPSNEDVAKIKECAKRLGEEFPRALIRVIPVLVTSRTETPLDPSMKQGARVVDGNELSDLLEKVRLGDGEGVRTFWGLY